MPITTIITIMSTTIIAIMITTVITNHHHRHHDHQHRQDPLLSDAQELRPHRGVGRPALRRAALPQGTPRLAVLPRRGP